MAEIIEKSASCDTPAKVYSVTVAPNIMPISQMEDGEVFTVSYWTKFKDENSKDPEAIILGIYDQEQGIAHATNSATFMDAFNNIVSIFGDSGYRLIKHTGISKNSREFVTCSYDMTQEEGFSKEVESIKLEEAE